MFLEFISIFFLLATSLVGIATIIWSVCRYFFDRALEEKAIVVLPLRGRIDKAEYLIKGCLHDLRKEKLHVAVVDFGMDDVTLGIVSRLEEEQDGLLLLSPEDLFDRLRDIGGAAEKI